MNFNERVQIRPLNLSSCSGEPQFQALSEIPHSQTDDDDLIVVVYVSDICMVKRGDVEDKVRDIIIVDESLKRPMKLSAWKEYAESDTPFLKAWPESFIVVGFTGIRPVYFQWLSLLTTLSTKYIQEPVGEIPDKVQAWAEQNSVKLEDWRSKAILLNSGEKKIIPVAEVTSKKPSTVWQDEKLWIQARLADIAERGVYCYVGCNMCGRSVPDSLGTKFICPHCKSSTSIGSARAIMNVIASDNTGSVKISAFTPEAELIMCTKAAEITALKNNEDPSAFAQKLVHIRNVFTFGQTEQLWLTQKGFGA